MASELPVVQGGFKTIYADPPWAEIGAGRIRRGADRHYALMKTEDIVRLPVRMIKSQEGCHLYLWATSNFLRDALRVMEAWGFDYKGHIVWVKGEETEGGEITLDVIGLGQYIRYVHELLLFGVYKVLPYRIRVDGRRAQWKSVLIEPRREHSQKPLKAYQYIEEVSWPPYLEMFARSRYDINWTVWGLEAPVEGSVA